MKDLQKRVLHSHKFEYLLASLLILTKNTKDNNPVTRNFQLKKLEFIIIASINNSNKNILTELID
ncbi:MAG: hypothetical protein Kow0049_24830 [Stanieria sp.]